MAPKLRAFAPIILGVLLFAASVQSAHAGHPAESSHAPPLFEAIVLEELAAINVERGVVDVPPLILAAELQDVADARAVAMSANGRLSHTDPAGQDAASLLDRAGIAYDRFGENLGECEASVADIVATLHAAWLESPAHRANILDPGFGRVGVGFAEDGGVVYAAVIFLD
jgi:uncharacterized protein YkwD